MTRPIRIYPISPRRAIAIFLPSQDVVFPPHGTRVKVDGEKISAQGTLDHGYIDFDTTTPTEEVLDGLLSW